MARRLRSRARRRSPSSAALRLASPELRTKLLLRTFENVSLPSGQIAAGAIHIEGQHRHRRLIRRSLPPPTSLRRPLERGRDPVRVLPGEDRALQGEGVAVFSDRR
jgi:hypothetical protein